MAESDPILALFESREGFYLRPDHLSTLYKSLDKSTQVTADQDPVGYIEDLSGNGHDFAAANTTERFKYVAASNSIENDQVDDRLTNSTLTLDGKIWTFVAGYSTLGTSDIIFLTKVNVNNPWAGVAQDGSTSTDLAGPGVTARRFWFGGTEAFPTTRGDVFNALTTESVFTHEFSVAAGEDFSDITFGKYFPGGFFAPKNVTFWLLIEGELTDEERQTIEASALGTSGS
ncbi:MAG: hypothetical protein GVY36_18850 [Verrucomicrobia bacterium]|nr:hypothetical protein [Verrucomicrobiota bacterium]